MTNNDVLRSLRYILDANDARMAEILSMGGGAADADLMRAFLAQPNDPRAVPMDDESMGQFLNGMVIARRGRDETRPTPPLETPITNNIVLKKVRVAFELKDEDMHAIFAAVGFPVTKPALSSFFRAAGNPHYRPCEDQYLRNFLKGLAQRPRK